MHTRLSTDKRRLLASQDRCQTLKSLGKYYAYRASRANGRAHRHFVEKILETYIEFMQISWIPKKSNAQRRRVREAVKMEMESYRGKSR